MLFTLLVEVALLISCQQVWGYVYLDLNGVDSWTVMNANSSIKIPATVPGQVHLDLLKAKMIGDPYYRFNDDYQTWVALDNWTYYRTFDWSQPSKKVWLICSGLDTVANISVNGHQIASVSNQHQMYYLDITDGLKSTDNQITISFESAATYSINQANNYPYSVPGAGDYFHANRNFIRKCQSDFGWDWGPAFVPTGIWQDIGILGANETFIMYSVPQIIPDDDGGFQVTVNVYFMTTGLGVGGTVTVELAQSSSQEAFISSDAGEQMVTVDLGTYPEGKVDLWWPNGYGSAALYNTTTTINSSKGESHTEIRQVGFRKLEIVQETLPDKEEGLSFYIRVNGVPIFAKGSNWIPADAFTARATYDVLFKQLKSATLSHQNIVRVWGGGIFQVSDFYDICDQLGIMVWQEFMFSDALYPRDQAFLASVSEEVRHQVRRLAHHPSIALWSGNNENQGSAQSKTMYLIDYSVLYDGTVHATLVDYDLSRPYWPSSPSNGAIVDEPSRRLYIQRWGDSSDPHYGDIHQYDYTDLCTDVTKFPRPRFTSEYGFQSYPSLETLKAISEPQDWDNNSPLMLHRQHHPNGNKQLAQQMARFFHLPDNPDNATKFGDFIYLTQVVQAICIQAESEHYRRIKHEQNGYTMGAMYWQLMMHLSIHMGRPISLQSHTLQHCLLDDETDLENDIWQAQSWSSIEYGGRWKLLHYSAKNFFAPLLVSPFQENDIISVYVSSDLMRSVTGKLQVDVWTWMGELSHSFSADVDSSALGAGRVWTETVEAVVKSYKPSEVFLALSVIEEGQSSPSATNTFFPTGFTDVVLQKGNVSVSDVSSVNENEASFTLKSDVVAPFVYLQTDVLGYFSENGFLLFPGKPHAIMFTAWESFSIADFQNSLKTRTVADTYKM